MAIVVSDGWHFEVNFIPVTDSEEVLERFSAALRGAGWTVQRRGDGTNIVTDLSAHTVTDWKVTGTWEQLRDPSGVGGRELVVQSGAAGSMDVRVFGTKKGDSFSGGTASTRPTHASEFQLVGTSGAYDSSYLSLTDRFHIAANSAAQGTTNDVYGWYLIRRTAGTGAQWRRTIFEPLTTAADGTLGSADAEPWAAWTGATSWLSSGGLSGWYKAGLTGEAYVDAGLDRNTPAGLDQLNPYTNAYDLPPLFVVDATTGLKQRKGLCVNITMAGAAAHATVGDTYNISVAADARALFDTHTVRWPANIAPLL